MEHHIAREVFFNTPCHPERCASSYALASKNDSGSHFIFFQNALIHFFFFITSLFLLFHKNYYHFTKGKEPARSPKPAVSFPLNPFLFGHGLGFYPKNPLALEVSSVSYEQIWVGFFLRVEIYSGVTPTRLYRSGVL